MRAWLPAALLACALSTPLPAAGPTVELDEGLLVDQGDRLVERLLDLDQDSGNHSTWRAAVAQSTRLLAREHLWRVAVEPNTRRQLQGSFMGDYRRSVRLPRQWADGDGWFVNYVGHPIHGAAAGRTWLHSDPTARHLELRLSKEYWASRAKATRWIALYSLQFEFGPFSEASVGNVGLDPATTGWVDHVTTPLGGLAIIVAEDALDRYLVRLVERRTNNRVLRATVRMAVNPARAMANVVEGHWPWYRDRGGLQCCR